MNYTHYTDSEECNDMIWDAEHGLAPGEFIW